MCIRDSTNSGVGNRNVFKDAHSQIVLKGGDTDDILVATGGDSEIMGGDGSDIVIGGTGNNPISGNAHNDFLIGDLLLSEYFLGDDVLNGGPGNDLIEGGNGNDTFKVDVGSDIITDLGGASGGDSDVLIVSDGATANVTNVKNFVAGATTTSNSSGTVNISTLTDGGIVNMSAASGGYNITGQGGVDTLTGGKGDDTINGGLNADTISGGTGDDTLSGGADNDQMTGGDGVDTFKLKRFKKNDVSFSTDSCNVQFGKNYFRGNLNKYSVYLDPEDFEGFGIDLKLNSTIPPYRPQDGILKAGDDYFAWLSAVPNGVVSGDLIVNGKKTRLSGSGYHDHNWGNTPLQYLFDNWVWFRGEIEDKTIVAAVLYMTDKRGGYDVPILYIADSSKVHVNKFGEEGLYTRKSTRIASNFAQNSAKVLKNQRNLEWCKGKNVDLVKSFPTSIYLQKSASIQPRTSPSKFGGKFNSLFTSLLT